LGSIILAGIAIATAGFLVLRSEKKRAAVGRREMQLFLIGYIIISICEIFSVGEFPLNGTVRVVGFQLNQRLLNHVLTLPGFLRYPHWHDHRHMLDSNA
jgi:hypothetical protein